MRPDGQAVPKAGVYAVRAGPVLLPNLISYLEAQQPPEDHFSNQSSADLQSYHPQDDFMKLIVCGKEKALGLRFGLTLYGKWVLRMKDAIDQQFMALFQDLPTDTSFIEPGAYDLSQYDAAAATDPLVSVELPKTPSDAAQLLQRTDDDVPWKQAWLVLRTMTQNATYREQVLEQCTIPAPSQPREAVSRHA